MRWPGVLEQEIGEEYRIIEEKLNGTTAVWDGPDRRKPQGRQHASGALSGI
jgi:hypothetical protein